MSSFFRKPFLLLLRFQCSMRYEGVYARRCNHAPASEHGRIHLTKPSGYAMRLQASGSIHPLSYGEGIETLRWANSLGARPQSTCCP